MESEPSLDKDRAHADVEAKARKRVRELKDFYTHAAIFALVNAFLLAINLLDFSGTLWALWPLGGWGIALLMHAVTVYGLFGLGSTAWEERKVRELVLQEQEGLTAEQVRELLRQELHTGQPMEAERITRRLEHLEAIVTSQAWDRLEELDPSETDPPLDLDPEAEVDDPEHAAERLARRVR